MSNATHSDGTVTPYAVIKIVGPRIEWPGGEEVGDCCWEALSVAQADIS